MKERRRKGREGRREIKKRKVNERKGEGRRERKGGKTREESEVEKERRGEGRGESQLVERLIVMPHGVSLVPRG